MKREPGITDDEWEQLLVDRKKIAQDRMQREDNMKGFIGYLYLQEVAIKWETTLHDAEVRLMRGEMP